MVIEDIVNENIDQFRSFWLDLENKLKYIDLFKRGITSGDTLGLFFIKDSKAVLELTRYYKDFKKIVIYDAKGTINLLKDYDSIDEFNDPRVEYVYVGQNLPMKFDKIIMNPPYSLGNKITEAVLSSLNDDGDCVCLMPLSQYKAKGLYKHVDSFELADPGLFEDAEITNNLCICMLNRANDNTSDYLSLLLKAADSSLAEVYKYSIGKHTMQITGGKWKSPEDFDQNLDFLDSWRITSTSHGAIPSFRKCGTYYKWNTFTYSKGDKWTNGYVCIRFPTKKAKDNFCKYAYNYNTLDERKVHLCGRMLGGVNTANMTNIYYFAIPQIDWEHISNNPLWKAGNYDEAVLSEMGLKWNADKTVIVKDE